MTLSIILAILLLVAFGAIWGLLGKLRTLQQELNILPELQREYTKLETELKLKAEENSKLSHRQAELSEALLTSQKQTAELQTRLELQGQALKTEQASQQRLSEELKAQFKLLASDVLKERTQRLEERSSELLTPLREDLKRFTEKVEHSYSNEARERFSLQEQIKELVARSLQLGQEADQLSRALKGENKTQGNWGEMILEKILEGSGLERGKEYQVQESVISEDGSRFIPDVVINYPNGGNIVIDSKVSLVAYTDYVNAESEDERSRAAQRHIQSLQRHIEELSNKRYELLVKNSADFVMMFIPNEPAYALAISERPSLWEEAYRKQVILMNGTNLIAALRMALDLWRRERQVKNVERIIEEANKMYDAFVRFAERFTDAEKQLSKAQQTLSAARSTLTSGRGNLAGRFQKLSKMGLSIKRQLPDELRHDLDEEDETPLCLEESTNAPSLEHQPPSLED